MRPFAFARNTLLLVFLANPVLLFAQFQQPTPDELKMTADPKAPGAAAVYLYIQETTDDQLHFKSYYARIKVLEEKGKDLASVEIPYERGGFKITDIKGRSIHSDGTVIPLSVKPEDLVIVKAVDSNGGKQQFNRKVFNLPSVEVGSILEYSYQVHYDDHWISSPHWQIQQPYFVHQAHYAFKPLASYSNGVLGGSTNMAVDKNGKLAPFLLWTSLLPGTASVKTDNFGHYLVDLIDIQPSPREEWMPPLHSLLYNVRFYYKNAVDNVNFWQAESKQWSKEVDHFAESSNTFKHAVAELVAPGDSDLDKARKLYKAVQALDNTGFSRKKDEAELKELKLKAAKRAEDTWAQKSGSSQDIALLYLAMLRSSGLTAYAMEVVNRDEGVFDPSYLDADQFDDTLVILSIGGREIVLDPGEKMCPFQTLHWKHEAATGIRQNSNGAVAAGSPSDVYTTNTLQRTGNLAVDAQGAVAGTFLFAFTGQEALLWRQAALRNDEGEVRKQFDHWLKESVPEGVEAHIDRFTTLDNLDVPLGAVVDIKGSLGTVTARRLLLPGYIFQTRGGHPFVDQAERINPVDMLYGEVLTDQIAYHLPTGFAVEAAPQDARIPWIGYAVLVDHSKADPAQITLTRLFSRAFALLKPEQYQDLRSFYQKVATADQQQLVLATAPLEKGN